MEGMEGMEGVKTSCLPISHSWILDAMLCHTTLCHPESHLHFVQVTSREEEEARRERGSRGDDDALTWCDRIIYDVIMYELRAEQSRGSWKGWRFVRYMLYLYIYLYTYLYVWLYIENMKVKVWDAWLWDAWPFFFLFFFFSFLFYFFFTFQFLSLFTSFSFRFLFHFTSFLFFSFPFLSFL